jgi:4-oxalocrotonate tautomerase
MPLVEVTLIEGRSADALKGLMAEVAQVVSRRCDAPLETVRVILREVPARHWSVGGVPKGEFPET